MDIPVADWVLQTTTTVGTGTITLSLPAPGYTDLQDALKASGDVWYSLLSSTGDRECGIGYFDYDTNTLQRTTIHATLKSGKHSNVSPTPIELKGQSLVSCTFNAESWKQFITDVQVGDAYSLSSTSDPEVTNTGTHSVPVLNFGIPKGDKGDAATIAIAPTVTGNPGTQASVINEGDEHNAVLKFTIPGSVEVSIGSTTTLDAGTQATVVDGNPDLDKVVLNFGIPRGDTGLSGIGAVVNTVADLRAAPPNGTAITLGCLAAGDGGGGFWRWDATNSRDDNTGTIVCPTVHVGNGRWIREITGPIDVRWFGAKGDSDYEAAGTDDTAAIQAALDFCIRYQEHTTVQIPSGWVCKTTNTLHLGYGQSPAFCMIVLQGSNVGAPLNSNSAIVYCGPPDRPVINIQGGTRSKVQGLTIWRQTSKWASTFPRRPWPQSDYAANLSNYVEAGAVTAYTAPFCAIAIDAYANSSDGNKYPEQFPNGQRYPEVNYPSWVSATPTQYNKQITTNPFIVDCTIRGFYVAILQSPINSNQGDFTKIVNCTVLNCGYGFCWANQNARHIDITNWSAAALWCAFSNTLFRSGDPGGPVGASSVNIVNGQLNSAGYQVFDLAMGAMPIVVTNCYTEELITLGSIINITNTRVTAKLIACDIAYVRDQTAAGGQAINYVPPFLAKIDGTFDNVNFYNVWGIEGIAGSAQLRDCMVYNRRLPSQFPSDGSPANIGMTYTGGIAHTNLAMSDRYNEFKGAFNVAYRDTLPVNILGGDTAPAIGGTGGAWVYSDNFDNRVGITVLGNGRYKMPAAKCLRLTLGTNWVVTGHTATVTCTLMGTASGVKPKIGDVLTRNGSDVLLVTGYDDITKALTVHICTSWKMNTDGSYVFYGALPTGSSTWKMFRMGKNVLGNGYSISCTLGSSVVTIKQRNNTTVTDPSTLISAGETMTVCPDSYNTALLPPPFVGAVEVVSISGSDITVNQAALKTATFPWAPALPEYPDF